MALTLPLLNLPTGLDLPDAYIKFSALQLDALSESALITVAIYRDAEARNAGKHPVPVPFPSVHQVKGDLYTQIFTPNALPELESVHELCYRALKLLPLFTEAIDC